MARRKQARRDTGDQLTASAAALATAMAALDTFKAGKGTPVRWTLDADAVIRAGRKKGVPAATICKIVGPLLGRTVSENAVRMRVEALGI